METPHLKNQRLRMGQNKLPKWAEYSCQTHGPTKRVKHLAHDMLA
jgi:hypothetical protein